MLKKQVSCVTYLHKEVRKGSKMMEKVEENEVRIYRSRVQSMLDYIWP